MPEVSNEVLRDIAERFIASADQHAIRGDHDEAIEALKHAISLLRIIAKQPHGDPEPSWISAPTSVGDDPVILRKSDLDRLKQTKTPDDDYLKIEIFTDGSGGIEVNRISNNGEWERVSNFYDIPSAISAIKSYTNKE